MMITEPQVRRIIPNAPSERVKEFVSSFNKYSDVFGLNTKIRVVHFLAQAFHECAALTRFEENLNYSADGLLRTFPKYFKTQEKAEEYARQPQKIANYVYGGRMGNVAEDDGWRYRGRGIIMLTGKSNYAEYQRSGFCNGSLLSHPEWLSQFPGALKSAMWYWITHDLNRLADNDDVETITRRINGGVNGMAQRKYYLRMAKRVFCL